MNKMQNIKKRIAELDFFRGVCIILMLWDHFALLILKFDGLFWHLNETNSLWVYISFFHIYIRSFYRNVIRQIVVAIFFIISGIVTKFSQSPLKRIIKLAISAFIITLISITLSLITNKELFVFFGVIHCYTVCALIYYLLKKLKNKNVEFIFYIIIIFTSIIFYFVKPTHNYHNYFMILGIPNINYVSGFDYFPVFPYVGIFLIGVLIGRVYYNDYKTKLKLLEKPAFRPISFIGRKGIYVYLFHIPIMIIIIYVIGIFFT